MLDKGARGADFLVEAIADGSATRKQPKRELPTGSKIDLKGLDRKALKGTVWGVGAYGGGMVLRFLSTIVLTRLLVPEYFGLMTLLNTMITALTLFSDLGLTPSIIRSPRGDDRFFLDTAWTMQVIRGVGLWLLCCAFSWPLAKFYGQDQLRMLVPIIGLSLVVSGFNSTSIASQSRKMAVRELALMEISVQFFQLIFTVSWALVQHSVWALVAGRLLADCVRLAISYRLEPRLPNSFRWDPAAAHELLNFGRWVFLSTALVFLGTQSDRMILGKLVSLETLGLYGVAYAISDIPRQIVMSLRGYIFLPFVSKLTNLPRPEFFSLVQRYRWKILPVAALLLGFVVASGDLAMRAIYDSRYHGASWIVPILAIGLWQTILYSTSSPCLLALGNARNSAIGNGFTALAILVLTPLAFFEWGLTGAVFAVAFSDFPFYLVNLYGLRRESMCPWKQDQLATLLFVAITASLVAFRISLGYPLSIPPGLH